MELGTDFTLHFIQETIADEEVVYNLISLSYRALFV